MDAERTELTWSYEPKNLLEVAYERTEGDVQISINDGKAVAKVQGGEPQEQEEKRLHAAVLRILQVLALQTDRRFELDPTPNVTEFQGPNRNIKMRMGVGAIVMTGGSVDFVKTDAAGKIVVDTKAERIEQQKADVDDISAKAQNHPVLSKMLDSYSAAMTDTEAEFVRLYEIRDAIVGHYGKEGEARAALNISSGDWSRFGQLANDAPVVEGRHRGKNLGPVRAATTAERNDMRRLAKEWIRKFAAAL
jgi:hypothetical protein